MTLEEYERQGKYGRLTPRPTVGENIKNILMMDLGGRNSWNWDKRRDAEAAAATQARMQNESELERYYGLTPAMRAREGVLAGQARADADAAHKQSDNWVREYIKSANPNLPPDAVEKMLSDYKNTMGQVNAGAANAASEANRREVAEGYSPYAGQVGAGKGAVDLSYGAAMDQENRNRQARAQGAAPNQAAIGMAGSTAELADAHAGKATAEQRQQKSEYEREIDAAVQDASRNLAVNKVGLANSAVLRDSKIADFMDKLDPTGEKAAKAAEARGNIVPMGAGGLYDLGKDQAITPNHNKPLAVDVVTGTNLMGIPTKARAWFNPETGQFAYNPLTPPTDPQGMTPVPSTNAIPPMQNLTPSVINVRPMPKK